MQRNILITFASTHHALKAEKLVSGRGCDFDIIPTPRAITASCGLSLELREDELAHALESLRSQQVVPEAVYRRLAKDQFEKIN
jgi:hypothetical protein